MVQLKEEIAPCVAIQHFIGKRSNVAIDDEEIVSKRRKYVNFTPNCLDFIHSSVEENKQSRYTKLGNRKNMVFSLIGNENKLLKTIMHGHGFKQGSPDNRFYNVAWTSSFISVPKDRSKMEEAFVRNNNKTKKPVQYIVKPTHSSEGKGIFFITKAEELPEKTKLLVSRYIEKPFLVNDHKFDLRIYAAVTSIYPLVVYLYSEGLTRFASSKYSEEIGESASFVHLTNYSLNKTSETYVRNESLSAEDHGHKWTLGALLRHLDSQGYDSKLFMLRVEDLVVKTFLSVQSTIASVARNTILSVGRFDILIDEQLKPWLLEVNLNPSLATEAPLDVLLKPQMIADLLNLICVPQVDPSTGIPEEKTKVSLKRYKKPSNNLRCISESAIERRVQEYKNRLALEEERRGGFVRIFPRENSYDLYKGIMEVSGPENYDCRLYESHFGEWDPLPDSTAQIYHNFMYNQFSQCPLKVKNLISNWYKETSLYVQKITAEGINYRASLPVVRKAARLRTDSYSSYLRKKKEIIAETTIEKKDTLGKENTDPTLI